MSIRTISSGHNSLPLAFSCPLHDAWYALSGCLAASFSSKGCWLQTSGACAFPPTQQHGSKQMASYTKLSQCERGTCSSKLGCDFPDRVPWGTVTPIGLQPWKLYWWLSRWPPLPAMWTLHVVACPSLIFLWIFLAPTHGIDSLISHADASPRQIVPNIFLGFSNPLETCHKQ